MALAPALTASPDRLLDQPRIEKGVIGLVEDGKSRDDDQHPLDYRGEILGLVMAIGMVGVRGTCTQADRDQGSGRGGNIDDALQRVGEQRDASGEIPGSEFEGEHQEPDQYAADGDVEGRLHQSAIVSTAARLSAGPPASNGVVTSTKVSG